MNYFVVPGNNIDIEDVILWCRDTLENDIEVAAGFYNADLQNPAVVRMADKEDLRVESRAKLNENGIPGINYYIRYRDAAVFTLTTEQDAAMFILKWNAVPYNPFLHY